MPEVEKSVSDLGACEEIPVLKLGTEHHGQHNLSDHVVLAIVFLELVVVGHRPGSQHIGIDIVHVVGAVEQDLVRGRESTELGAYIQDETFVLPLVAEAYHSATASYKLGIERTEVLVGVDWQSVEATGSGRIVVKQSGVATPTPHGDIVRGVAGYHRVVSLLFVVTVLRLCRK